MISFHMNDVLHFASVSSLIEKPFKPADLVNAISAAVNGTRGEVSKPFRLEAKALGEIIATATGSQTR